MELCGAMENASGLLKMVENVRRKQQKMKLVEQLILVECETCQLFIVSLTLAVFTASLSIM
jgi:hypothetical protein